MNLESILPFLGELFAKSAAVLLIATLIAWFWRGATAAQRHFFWLAAIAAVVLLPATRMVTPRWTIPLEQETRVRVTAANLPPALNLPEMSPAFVPDAPRISSPVLPNWRPLLLAAWLTGAACLLGYRLVGTWRLRRLEQSSAPLEDARIQELAARILRELKVGQNVTLRISGVCRVPMTWGGLRPVLLLPNEAATWSDAQILAALRHEAGHIRHWDYLVRWLAHFACSIYWPNPLIWLAARSLRVAQEQAVDDLVLRAGTSPEAYATQLFEAARTVGTRGYFASQAVAMASPSTLQARVVAILDRQRARLPLSRFAAAVGSTMVLLTLAICSAAQLHGADQPTTPPEGAREGTAGKGTAQGGGTPAAPPATDGILADPTIELSPIRTEEISDDGSAKHLALHIPIKVRPGKKIDVNAFVIHVLFYDLINGRTVVQTAANVRSHWVTPPADWTKGDTEELIVEYQLPKFGSDAAGIDDRKYFGYLVRVYYQRQLQAATAEPKLLAERYPPPATLPVPEDAAGQSPKIEDLFLNAYLTMGESEKLEVEQHFEEARARIQTTLKLLDEVVALDSEWEPKIVAFRKERAVKALQRLTLAIDAHGSAVAPPASPASPPTLLTKEWTVPPGMFGAGQSSAQDWLTAHGVKFGAGASALYVIGTHRLIVRNTQDEMGHVDGLIEAAAKAQPEAKSEGAGAEPAAVPAPAPENPLLSKAAKIIIPKIELHEATIAEAVEFLRAKATEFDPEKRGVNIILKPGSAAGAKITMSLTNIPLVEALRYVTGLSGLEMRSEANALVLASPAGAGIEAKAAPAAENVAITPVAKNSFKGTDSIEISAVSGSSSTFRVGGTYRVRGICHQNTIQNASLYLGNTAEGSGDAIKPASGGSLSIAAPKGSTEFDFTFTLLRPGRLHVTVYDLDQSDPKDNAYAGLFLGEVTP